MEHIFTPLVNLNTGKVFLDCTKKKLYIKFLLHTVSRPFHILFKTVYHLAIPISIPYIIFLTCKEGLNEKKNKGEIAKSCLLNSVRSLADIVRTPLYGIAMTLVNIAALVIGLVASKYLYDLRSLIGKLIQSLNRSKTFVHDYFGCFQALTMLEDIQRWDQMKKDTTYPLNASANLIGMNNFARAQIKLYRSLHSNCNTNPFVRKLGLNEIYKSASYADVEKAGFVDPS